MRKNKILLLDTTLRDGSYAIDFQFSAKETASIASRLEKAGVQYIEVGHGIGMNGASQYKSAASDEQYLQAASESVRKAKWGMFFIPGIGRMDDIALAAKYGMDFIRVGTNVTEVESSAPFIDKAKNLGMFVSSNFMKTYALPPREVGKLAKKAQKFGSDIVDIVDSAGGMLPEDVEKYFTAVKYYSDVMLGFHGHNNLGLANINSLKAIELGASIIDASVRGMGRSAGNASTEMLILLLRRKGIQDDIDITQIFNIGEKYIDPYLAKYRQVDSISIVSGYAQFHSSYLPKILKFSKKYKVDSRQLIVNVSAIDKVRVTDRLIENVAAKMKSGSFHAI